MIFKAHAKCCMLILSGGLAYDLSKDGVQKQIVCRMAGFILSLISLTFAENNV